MSVPVPPERDDPPATRSRRSAVVAGLVITLVALVAGGAYAAADFAQSDRRIVVGAHSATVAPAFDGYATFDAGPLLPQFRVPADAPLGLGVQIDIGETDAAGLDELVTRDAVIASQPDGEIRRIEGAVRGMAEVSALRGLGVALVLGALLGGAYVALGRERRRVLVTAVRHPLSGGRRRLGALGAAVVVTAAGVGLLVLPRGPADQVIAETGWQPLEDALPVTLPAALPVPVEVSSGAAADGAVALVQGALDTFEDSTIFYDDMLETVPAAVEQMRLPEDDETLAVHITDRHDNIGIDPVVAEIARGTGAELILDTGDDTSSGASWEVFSIDSMADAYADFEVVAVAGNHDSGDVVTQAYADAGFTVLDEEVEEVAGISFLGTSDPRASGLTRGYSSASETVTEQGERLSGIACEDGDVDTVLVHSPTTGDPIAADGCVPLVLSGHLHRQVGPTRFAGEQGDTVTMSTGTTGGAAFAFALGSKLRRDGQLTLVTYDDDGVPVGLQPIDLTTAGAVEPKDYIALDELPETAPETDD